MNQLQHMLSERKRREKLNDSFHALKAVLPPGTKVRAYSIVHGFLIILCFFNSLARVYGMQKDKTSILIRAREYVRSLESKVADLEEKNRLLESRLARGDDSSDDGSRKDAAAAARRLRQ